MLLIGIVLIFVVTTTPVTSLAGAFLAGLMVDLWRGNVLGGSSIIYLVIAYAVHLYKRKFDATSLWFLTPFLLMVITLLSLVSGGRLVSLPALFEYIMLQKWIVLLLGGFWLWKRISGEKRLSV
ncbi:hypothetical protein HY468_01225 [Candidatus Roizmanbacteria bacterium]|nr:hypothetical protein [Candidatus Roizmanbacteria bacterium]